MAPSSHARSGIRVPVAVAALLLAAPALVSPAVVSPASAQPIQLPGAVPSAPAGAPVTPPSGAPGGSLPSSLPGSGPSRQAPPPVRAIADDAVVGQALLHQGRSGRFIMERRPGGFGVRFTGDGFQINNLTEPCSVSFGDESVPVESLGRPQGLPRFRLQAPICPIVFDVLPNAVLVLEPTQPCLITAAQCRLTPLGLWGPDGRGLVALARDIERDRVRAEEQVREGFRQLMQRGDNADERRNVAREQAGFSAEREQTCRDYAREANHGFCAAKINEARAASIRARLAAGEPQRPAQRR